MATQTHSHSQNFGVPFCPTYDCLMDNSCGLDQQHKRQNQCQLQNMSVRNQDFRSDNMISCPDYHPSMVFYRAIETEIQQHSKEVDLLVSLQNERLRLALQEQKKQQTIFLLNNYESKAQILLRQKDGEIAKALNRMTELEGLLEKMETENQTWQRVAKENEAMIISLNNTMNQLKKSVSCRVEDAESCSEIVIKPKGPEQEADGTICKFCNCRSSSVIVLPCRHLCSCNVCEPFIESCPVCNMVKRASIEAFI